MFDETSSGDSDIDSLLCSEVLSENGVLCLGSPAESDGPADRSGRRMADVADSQSADTISPTLRDALGPVSSGVLNLFISPRYLLPGVVERTPMMTREACDYLEIRNRLMPSIAHKLNTITTLTNLSKSVVEHGNRIITRAIKSAKTNLDNVRAVEMRMSGYARFFQVFGSVLGVDYADTESPCAQAFQLRLLEDVAESPVYDTSAAVKTLRTLDGCIGVYLEAHPEVRGSFYSGPTTSAEMVMQHMLLMLAAAAEHHRVRDSECHGCVFNSHSAAIALADARSAPRSLDESAMDFALAKATVDLAHADILANLRLLEMKPVRPWSLNWATELCNLNSGDKKMIARSVLWDDEDKKRDAAKKTAELLLRLLYIARQL